MYDRRGRTSVWSRSTAAGRRRRTLEEQAEALLGLILIEPIHAAVAERYAHVKLERQAAGLSMDDNDLWIAADGLMLGATRITRDTNFRGVSGLTVEDWTA
jgi:predicted nucleic acid-binding protein